MRETTNPLRERPAPVFGVAPAAGPWIAVALSFLPFCLLWGVLLAVFGVGAAGTGFWLRAVEDSVAAMISSLVGSVLYLLLIRLSWFERRTWALATAAAALMVIPMATATSSLDALFGGSMSPTTFVDHLRAWLPISAIMWIAWALIMALWPRAAAPGDSAARFLDRLPLKLRGADLWAVEAEDHYLRLHTSKGQDLILMRLGDAIAELDGIEGARAHRSWWVARDAVVQARRRDHRAILTLKDGSAVPVSRSYTLALREKGWI